MGFDFISPHPYFYSYSCPNPPIPATSTQTHAHINAHSRPEILSEIHEKQSKGILLSWLLIGKRKVTAALGIIVIIDTE